MKICTIGFSKKNLKEFIRRLQKAGVKKIIDVRLNNTSQLAGYAKKDDLEYVLSLVGIDYEHHPELAPSEEILKGYKQKQITWNEYETKFNELLKSRNPEKNINFEAELNPVSLLCSEDKPQQCHRRLVAEYFQARMQGIEIEHL